jgi:hypothetical protein
MSESATLDVPITDPATSIDIDALAEKVVEKLKNPKVQPEYELLGFTIVGKELRATVRTPSGEVFQGSVTNWERVTVVEVPK